MFQVLATGRFEKDVKQCSKRHYDMALLREVILMLQQTGTLPEKYKTHKLAGSFVHHWEAHIKPDWLILWLRDDNAKTVTLVRTGTHADLF